MKLHDKNAQSNTILISGEKRLGWSSFFQDQLEDTTGSSIPVRIIGVRKNSYLVWLDGEEVLATLAGKLLYGKKCGKKAQLPTVGDWVLLNGTVITSVLARKNILVRKMAGGRDRKNSQFPLEDQGIAANLDMVGVVCGLDRDFNPRRIERYLTMVYNCGITPTIILTKADLHDDPDGCVHEVESRVCGVPVYTVAHNDEQGLHAFAKHLNAGQTAALIGSSGAGKSTLINRLYGKTVRSTGEVGERVKKGKHTTTSRDLILLPWGGMIIDNPGIREIGLGAESGENESAFPDIETHAHLCKFADCTHTHEPGCHVLKKVESGEISSDRLKNYHKIINELDYHLQRETKSASRLEKEKWKAVALKVKSIKKGRTG